MSKPQSTKSSTLVHLVQPLPTHIVAAEREALFEETRLKRDLAYERLDNRRLKELLFLKDQSLDFLADELEEAIIQRRPLPFTTAIRFVSRLRGIAHKFESGKQ